MNDIGFGAPACPFAVLHAIGEIGFNVHGNRRRGFSAYYDAHVQRFAYNNLSAALGSLEATCGGVS